MPVMLSGVKRLNSGVKRGEVIYRMCSENTHIHIYTVTACAAAGFLPYRKWGALKEKASHVTEKKNNRRKTVKRVVESEHVFVLS